MKFKQMGVLLCGSTSLLAVVGAGSAAAAQSVPPAVQSVPPKTETESSAPEGTALTEVVVTAQRRSENLQKVPVAVSVVTATTAKAIGMSGTTDLQVAVPSLTINVTGGGGAAVTMRGVTGTGSLGDESPTAFYLDGQYLAGLSGLYFSLNNIDQIEVLKGPQGTLFGRNSVGGAIQIITKAPSFSPSAEMTVGYGNYGTATGQFYGTAALSDKVAVDLALYAEHQEDGWGRNVDLGVDAHKGENYGVRGKLLWLPTDADSVTLALGYTYTVSPEIQGGYDIRPGLPNAAGVVSNSIYNTDGNVINSPVTGQFLASVNFVHHFGWADLVSITGYEDTRDSTLLDEDYTPLSSSIAFGAGHTRSITQELHLASVGGPDPKLSWIAGLFYDHIDGSGISYSGPSQTIFSASETDLPTAAYAAFGQATYQILPATNLTAGLIAKCQHR
jgi:iron complex outermembrane recepter protein